MIFRIGFKMIEMDGQICVSSLSVSLYCTMLRINPGPGLVGTHTHSLARFN